MKSVYSFLQTSHFSKITFLAALTCMLPGCGGDKPLTKLKDLEFEELEKQVKDQASDEDHKTKILEQIIAKFPDHPHIANYKMQLADHCFEQEKFATAYDLYEHFSRMYPTDARSEFAQFQSINSKFQLSREINDDCDSSDTKEAIKQCADYLTREMSQSFKTEVSSIKATCEERLLDKEIHVYNSYLRRGKYQSAQHRLDYLKEHFLPVNSELAPRILFLECKLAERKNDRDIAIKHLESLINTYPTSQFTRMAESIMNKKAFFA
jgi:outer membrane assembly lipoprotein YfiO